MPELSRFFGIVIRMFVEVGGRITGRTSTRTTRSTWRSWESIRST